MEKRKSKPSDHEEEDLQQNIHDEESSSSFEESKDRIDSAEQKLFVSCIDKRNFKPYFKRYPNGHFTKKDAEFCKDQVPSLFFSFLFTILVLIIYLVKKRLFWPLVFCLLLFTCQ